MQVGFKISRQSSNIAPRISPGIFSDQSDLMSNKMLMYQTWAKHLVLFEAFLSVSQKEFAGPVCSFGAGERFSRIEVSSYSTSSLYTAEIIIFVMK